MDKALSNLLNAFKKNRPDGNVKLIEEAYDYAKKNLQSSRIPPRKPFFEHSLNTAKIMNELELEETVLACGLLHHVLADGTGNEIEIKKIFGDDITELISVFSKGQRYPQLSKETDEKRLLFFLHDIRLFLISICSRLEFSTDIPNFSEKTKKEEAEANIALYSPLCAKLGLQRIKEQLEDSSLKILEPEKYDEIQNKIRKKKKHREKEIKKIIKKLETIMEKNGLECTIEGRTKSVYSVYRKMKEKNKTFEEIYDLNAIRIIVNKVKECYETLGIMHSIWIPLPGEFEDYIAKPKENMYQSIHTVVIGPDHKPLEIQIRTHEMHKNAKYGIAAHWKYKGYKEDKKNEKKIAWLNQLYELNQKRGRLIESLKDIDFFEHDIYVFTPKGEIVELKEDSTPIDFAYAIHSEVGNHCKQAKVNNKIVSLSHQLKKGDKVEIITSKTETVKKSWLNIIKTGKARKKILSKLNIKKTGESKKDDFKPIKNLIVDKENSQVRIAKCCNPVPGDDIIGFLTTKRKVIIHRKDCERIKSNLNDKTFVDVVWGKHKEKYSTTIKVRAKDAPGILADILDKISKTKTKIISTSAKSSQSNTSTCLFTLDITDLDQLDKVIASIRKIKDVNFVDRV